MQVDVDDEDEDEDEDEGEDFGQSGTSFCTARTKSMSWFARVRASRASDRWVVMTMMWRGMDM